MQKKILVTGATGYIGGRLVSRLLKMDYSVRCLVRNPKNLEAENWEGVEIFQGDVLQEETLIPALADIEVAYYLVHSMRQGEQGFEDRDRLAAKNFAAAAQKANLQQIIYLGALGHEGSHLSPHLKSRQEVGELLRSTGVPVTEFRAAIIVGSGSISFEMIRYLTERLPIMICPQWVKSRCQPIAIRDVLQYLLESIEEPKSRGKILEIGGADILTYREIMLGYAKVRGLKRYILDVPILTPRLSGYWVDFITPIPASLARPLIEGLKNDVVCKNALARELFKKIIPMGYHEAVQLALNRIQQAEIETIWSGSTASLGREEASQHYLENKEGMTIEVRRVNIKTNPEKIFSVICSIGGNQGWFFANWVWRLRGLLDRMVGGIGMRRGRRHPYQLRVGDAVDFWRVEALEKNHLLRLRAEMKLPGKAWLQFNITTKENLTDTATFTQTAFFEPKGLVGQLYWIILYPIHTIIFSGLCRSIKRKAESYQEPVGGPGG